MKSVDPRLDAAARRLRLALDLFETGEELMRQQLRQEHPALTTAGFLDALAGSTPHEGHDPPVLRRLRGALRGVSVADYRAHVKRKHR